MNMTKNVEIPKWLERLPLAPEFRPTDTEFADPVAYISKIEKEASTFGLCKIIPPLPKPSRKYVLRNLNKSLSRCPELGSDVNLVKSDSGARHNCDRNVNSGESRAVFTTRQQELGCEKAKRVKWTVGGPVIGAQKQVWQSGEVYTIEQFEAKSKNFAKSHLAMVKEVNPLVIEAMFWKASSEKPIYVEYANDVPGSGFGEPEGLLRYVDRRRRKRRKRNLFDRSYSVNDDSNNHRVDKVDSVRVNEDLISQNNPNLCLETASNSNPSFSGRRDFPGDDEMEGTAGWKLSNSPWNIQVIARSQGSLTRYMPDDIPGVTSPMVYIGMLFSWFAWHVEDHELHSLNFLHMGSPKTWYAVPGDYAVSFEEAIRLHACGGNADRLVALSLLGQKTTVLSPEIIVASGIPCCRLVQNPGEFVVTFPRAYHIGFSHGFNCGEAANFGTPKWLTIAKEAALRRAAMNYLPMLSHQQLLYLLTMSFISRIPRSLLPGVRSSRSRGRQKEERELLVKRAFIEDILHENSLLTVLLQRNSSCRAVLWDVESMPSSSKESKLNKDTSAAVLTSGEESLKNDDITNDIKHLSDYICAVDFDINDDNLPYGFQIESGSLPCVACGILGFPFMAVLQPSDMAWIELLSDHGHLVEEGPAEGTRNCGHKVRIYPRSLPCEDGDGGISLPIGGDGMQGAANKARSRKNHLHRVNEASSVTKKSHSTTSSNVEITEGWNISNVSLRPRIFCIEHAIEIEKLLNSKGGANVLVICHSDFQKIKSHAAGIAEEITAPFCYTEIPLDNAFPEDLNLIEIAIDREEQADHPEDWTSHLNINLQHSVKVKKSFPSKNVDHLLNFGGFCDSTPILNTYGVKWMSRKLRSKKHLKKPVLPSKRVDGGEIMKTKKEDLIKDVKIIHYSRKRYKARGSVGILGPFGNRNLVVRDSLDTDKKDPDKEDKNNSVIRVDEDKMGNSCDNSETAGSALDENRIECGAENETLRDEVNEYAVASETCEQPTEYDCGTPHDIRPDGYDEEASRKRSLSNFSDKNDPPLECDEQMEQHASHDDSGKNVYLVEKKLEDDPTSTSQSEPKAKTGSKRGREANRQSAGQFDFSGFIRSPCEGLRTRKKLNTSGGLTDDKNPARKSKKTTKCSVPYKIKKENKNGRYECELDGCTMSFQAKAELILHKGNQCPVKGCRKKFNSHKCAVQHVRVHNDDRPLRCTWAGCTMSFKWAWARTEHLRLHTGERRHRRKTGHYVGPPP
ncbi:hypothetical protein OROHE_027021 [Orobanche hederae]